MTRTKLVTVRFSEAEFARLTAAAEATLTSLSGFLRGRAFVSTSDGVPLPALPRPALEGPLTRQVTSRLTAAEAERLAEQARDCDLSVAAYVRQLLRGSTPSPRRRDAHAAVVALSRIGNNLNQLTRLAHGGTLLSEDLFRAVDTLRAEVYRVRDEILAEGARP